MGAPHLAAGETKAVRPYQSGCRGSRDSCVGEAKAAYLGGSHQARAAGCPPFAVRGESTLSRGQAGGRGDILPRRPPGSGARGGFRFPEEQMTAGPIPCSRDEEEVSDRYRRPRSPMKGWIMLRLMEITKRFQGEPALEGVSLEMPEGETTVLIGPSGCGKSTLLRIIVGLISPDAGRVFLNGRELHAETMLEERHAMGYVIQEGGLFPHLTARGNVTLAAETLGWSRERMSAGIEELSALTHLPAEILSRYPAQLSGGQRQRVSLMRALMLDPALLLLDEPLAALDPMIRAELQQDLREIFRALGKTVVLVTHDMGEAAFFGDRIVMMRKGRVVQEGSLEDLLERPGDPFVTRFIRAQRSPLERDV